MIDLSAAESIETWLKEAKDHGATVLTGGTRDGTLVQPTGMASLQEDMSVSCQKIFGPMVGLYRYHYVHKAIHAVGASDFGLQAGIFTHDLNIIQEAFEEIEVGGLIVNDVPHVPD